MYSRKAENPEWNGMSPAKRSGGRGGIIPGKAARPGNPDTPGKPGILWMIGGACWSGRLPAASWTRAAEAGFSWNASSGVFTSDNLKRLLCASFTSKSDEESVFEALLQRADSSSTLAHFCSLTFGFSDSKCPYILAKNSRGDDGVGVTSGVFWLVWLPIMLGCDSGEG